MTILPQTIPRSRSLPLLIAVVLAWSTVAASQADPTPLLAIRNSIRELLVAKQAVQALEAIRPHLEQFPDDPGLHALHGEAFFALDRPAEAVEAFARAVALDGTYQGKLFNYGRALQGLDRHDEAIEVFEAMRSAETPQRRAQGSFGIGLSRQALGDDDAAVDAFRETLRIDSGFQRARYRLALLDIAHGRDAEAETALSEVLGVDPLHHGAAYNRALALGRLDRTVESEAAWERYRRILEGKQRISLLEERLTGGPGDAESLLELGRVHAELGAHGVALTWYSRASSVLSFDPRPPLGAVAALCALGRNEDAEGLCTMLLGRIPPMEELRAPLIEMLEKRGAKAEADRWRRP